MKNLITILLVGLISLTTNAQKIIEKTIDFNNQYIDVELKFASEIEVKTWNKSTVYFKADITTKDGRFLDQYELNIEEKANNISITSIAEPYFKAYHDDWNKKNPSRKERYYFNSEDMYTFKYVIYIPKNAKFKISSINGDLKSEIIEGEFTADLINGNIDIAKYSGDLTLSTINGEIDLKMINANLVAETIHGDIYADEKLKFTSTNRFVGQKIAGKTDKATNSLRLNTINGNMYLRL